MKRTSLDAGNSSILAIEGNLKEIKNEEGEYLGHFPAILIRLWLNEKEYVNKAFCKYGWNAKQLAERFIDEIEKKGSVNLEKWQAEPKQTFEERYLSNMEAAEREERFNEGF